MRLCADEKIEGGVDPDTRRRSWPLLDGKLDFINVDSGSFSNFEALNQHALQTQPLYVDPGYGLYMSEPIMKVAKLTKIGIAGRIADPLVADTIIESGQADYVGMTRALIADPELPRKAMEGRLAEIRPCIATAQDCWGRSVAHEWPMRCTVNPAVGFEGTRGQHVSREVQTSSKKRKILIVGAGVAGLEAARASSERGHEVVVYEREAEVGGQVNLARLLPGRARHDAILPWYRTQLKKNGVGSTRKGIGSPERGAVFVEEEDLTRC